LAAFLFGLLLITPGALAGPQTAPAPALIGSPFEAAAVGSTDGRVFTLSWHARGVQNVDIYAGTDPQNVGHRHKVATGTGDGTVTVSDLTPAARWYFEMVPDHGTPVMVADRALHLQTASNFRDIGGYRTTDGKWVRMGLAYRSNGLEHLTPAELETLGTLGLKLVCDLRTDDERLHGPDRVAGGTASLVADVMADNPDPATKGPTAGAGQPALDPVARLSPVYQGFVSLGSAQKAYHLLFERLADRQALPTVFHCTAGKDRTGWAAAVLLTLLGVPHATVLADYQLTDRYLDDAAAEAIRQQRYPSVDEVTWRRMVAADPAYLEAAFDEATQRYGSFAGYLHQGLGLDDATLVAIRRNFLAD
jgi:protein-tyrosine phosphatase